MGERAIKIKDKSRSKAKTHNEAWGKKIKVKGDFDIEPA
jgi:hypothetical protein